MFRKLTMNKNVVAVVASAFQKSGNDGTGGILAPIAFALLRDESGRTASRGFGSLNNCLGLFAMRGGSVSHDLLLTFL